jgi:hypothetical protein
MARDLIRKSVPGLDLFGVAIFGIMRGHNENPPRRVPARAYLHSVSTNALKLKRHYCRHQRHLPLT